MKANTVRFLTGLSNQTLNKVWEADVLGMQKAERFYRRGLISLAEYTEVVDNHLDMVKALNAIQYE